MYNYQILFQLILFEPSDLTEEKILLSARFLPLSVTFDAEPAGKIIVAVVLAGILTVTIILFSFLSQPDAIRTA